MVNKRKYRFLLTTMIVLAISILCAGKAFAGRNWSEQAFDKQTGITVIGAENKFARVFGISILNKKVLWQVGMPQSRGIDIHIEDEKVYLVSPEDVRFQKTMRAVNIATGETYWANRLKKNKRRTKVYYDDNTLYFATEEKYRDIIKVKLYAFDKETGKTRWTPYWIRGTFKEMLRTETGDFILIVLASQKTEGGKDLKHTVKSIKIDKNTGLEVWERPIEGSFVSFPKENSGVIYFITQKIIDNVQKMTFQAINAEDGSVLSTHEIPEGEKPLGDAIFYQGKPIITMESGKVFYIDGTKTDISEMVLWEKNLDSLPVFGPKIIENLVLVATMKTNYLISIDEIVEWEGLLSQLKEHNTPATSRIWELLDENTRSVIDGITSPEELNENSRLTIIEGLNGIISNKEFYARESFKEVKLANEVNTLLNRFSKLDENKIQRLNRCLMESILVREISQNRYYIHALDASTGKSLWEKPYMVEGTLELPVFIEGDRLIVGSRSKKEEGEGKNKTTKQMFRIVALDPANAREMWKQEQEGKLENPLSIKDQMLYVMLYRKVEENDVVKPAHLLIAINIGDGTERWTYATKTVINTKLYVDEDSVDFGTKAGFATSVGLVDGKNIYKFFAGINNEMDSSIVTVQNLLGFATQDGKYFILTKQGKKVKAFNLKPWFALWKLPIFIGCLLLSSALSWYIYHARKGKKMFIRRIAGLTAIDEAVGRATEMGKPVLYITGLADVDDIQTLASLSIMGHIAQKTAEYDTPIIVPCCRSVVMSTAQEVVKESYLKAGRPDTYRKENIHYLTDDQFGYVAGVDGIMVREKPAANFYLGKFYAESLILAETGHSTGAIQIAGTAEAAQLPFFVAACDYTLIGEELFAASAYLSKDPQQIGSLKGQDIAKAIMLAVIIIGCILLTFDIDWMKLLLSTQ
ncbi:MAG: PQQ-like beta-propeller repeat protein [Candidatus Eremiobacteraeota bacterium]|nr:PQQ-like beta-propeller repeat protein [Candidatus Eremiobacteraeota bacterium]